MKDRRRPHPLSPAEIVDTALAIVDDEGLEALTMRRLGAALDVEAMALYRHVRNKDALLDLLVERMRSELRLEQPPPRPTSRLLEEVFVAYWRVLMAHPNMLPLATRRTASSGVSGLEHLVEAGMASEDATELYQSLTALTVGFAVVAVQSGEWVGLPEPLAQRMGRWEEATLRRSVRQLLEGYGLTSRGDRDDRDA